MHPILRVATAGAFTVAALATSVVSTTTADAQSPPPPPQAITTCGQTITKARSYLTKDLVCSTGFTFSYAENGGTYLDLRGHRLQGKGTGRGIDVEGDAGGNSVSVTIVNGRIDHWDTAVFSFFGGVTLKKMSIDHNATGLSVGKGTGDVTDSIFANNKLGSSAFDGGLSFNRTLLTQNKVGSEVQTGSGGQGDYTNSQFVGNGTGVLVDSAVDAYVSNSIFIGNQYGVRSEADGGASLTGNLFTFNRDGVYLPAPDLDGVMRTLKNNRADNNTRYGIYAPGATDLGGNRANSNGKPCVGVTCTS